jgi:hypothetical protein
LLTALVTPPDSALIDEIEMIRPPVSGFGMIGAQA